MLFIKTLISVIASSSVAIAGVTRAKPQVQVFKNNACRTTNTCSLQEFKLQTIEYRVKLSKGGTSFGTDALISYKTTRTSELEDYAVVQFIRGCKFNSMRSPEGKINKFIMAREYFGKIVSFKHPQWVIDSIDTDPMYNNGPQDKRHAYYRWQKGKDEAYYFREKPPRPELFTTDLPGTASMENPNAIATNISLQFKTCLYRTQDVPLSSEPDHLDFGRPVKCFNWASSYIYNHQKNLFESKQEIDPFCSQN